MFQFETPQRRESRRSLFSASGSERDLDDIMEELQRYKDLNRKILLELQAADKYDKSRGLTGGQARLHFALAAIENNKEEIARLEREVEEWRNRKDNFFHKYFCCCFIGKKKRKKSKRARRNEVMSLASIPSPVVRTKAASTASSFSTPISTPTLEKSYTSSQSSFKVADDLRASAERSRMDLVDAYLESTIKPSTLRSTGFSSRSKSANAKSSSESAPMEDNMRRAASAKAYEKGKVTEIDSSKKSAPTTDDSKPEGQLIRIETEENSGQLNVKADESIGEPCNAEVRGSATVESPAPAPIPSAERSKAQSSELYGSTDYQRNVMEADSTTAAPNTPSLITDDPSEESERTLRPSVRLSRFKADKVDLPPFYKAAAVEGDGGSDGKRISLSKDSNSQRTQTGASEADDGEASSRRRSFVLNGQLVMHLPYDVLVRGSPPGVDPDKKEDLLSNEEFEELFHMSKSKFESLPKWRRDQLKKQLNLF